MNRLDAIEEWADAYEHKVLLIGRDADERKEFGDALLGISTELREDSEGEPIPIAIYSTEKTIEVYMNRDGMSHEEAVEFFEFNTKGAYLGPNTPIFIDTFDWEIKTKGDIDGGTQ